MADNGAAERYYELVEAELNEERAAVLGRYGRRVEKAIAHCQALLEMLDEHDHRAVEAYRAARQSALHAVAELCLQREAVGLLDHAWVDRIYRVPPSLRR